MGRDGSSGDTFDLPDGHPDEGTPVAAYYFWLFPNLMLNFYPWGLSLKVVQPLGPERTRVSFRSYVWREVLREQGAAAELHRVEMEDEEIVESVQRGVRSRLYDRGRYSPKREVGAHHFLRRPTLRPAGEGATVRVLREERRVDRLGRAPEFWAGQIRLRRDTSCVAPHG